MGLETMSYYVIFNILLHNQIANFVHLNDPSDPNMDSHYKPLIKKSNDLQKNKVGDINNNLEEVTSHKYVIIDPHHKLNWNYRIKKRKNGGLKYYYHLEYNCKLVDLYL